MMTNKLIRFEKNFEIAKMKYAEIMEGENDAAILFKWLAENDINEWGVFHGGAHYSDTLEGWISMYHHLHHALYDDGDVTFVKTRFQGPKIIFYWKKENNFEEVFMENIHDTLKESFKIVGYMDTVQEYIAEYERYEAERNEIYERFYKNVESQQ